MKNSFLLLPESITSREEHNCAALTNEKDNKKFEENIDIFHELIRFISIGGTI
jgi:hypothetical protein